MRRNNIGPADGFEYAELYADLREQAYARLATRDPACAMTGCGERDPIALTRTAVGILCYEHRRDQSGARWLEDQHPSGRGSDTTTVRIPGNDHRIIDAAKQTWDRQTLRGEHGPLRAAAAAIRGWLDTLFVVMTRSVGWVPAALEALDTLLVTTIGPTWWATIGWVAS